MRRYECIIIINPEIPEEGVTKIIEKVTNEINESKGLLVEVDDWGIRKLAYEIKKKLRGRYIRFDFCTKVELINKIEDYYKITDSVLKYMTVVTNRDVDIDLVKESIIKKNESESNTKEEMNSEIEANKSNQQSEIIEKKLGV